MLMTLLVCHTWDVVAYFGMYEKRRSLAILWNHLDVLYMEAFSSSEEGGNHPLVKRITKKALVRRGLKSLYILHNLIKI